MGYAKVSAHVTQGAELYISRGSLYETMTLLETFRRKAWISDDNYAQLEIYGKEVASMIKGLINSIS